MAWLALHHDGEGTGDRLDGGHLKLPSGEAAASLLQLALAEPDRLGGGPVVSLIEGRPHAAREGGGPEEGLLHTY